MKIVEQLKEAILRAQAAQAEVDRLSSDLSATEAALREVQDELSSFEALYREVIASRLARVIVEEELCRTIALPARGGGGIMGPSVRAILFSLKGEMKEKYLMPVLRGEKTACFAQTEPDAGSDPGGMRTVAVRDGDHYVINGVKRFITAAGESDFMQLMAATDRAKGSHGGISCFLVDMDTPGVKLGARYNTMMGDKPWEIVLENVRVPLSHRVGEEGEGFKIAMSCIDQGRFTVGAGAVGLTKACLDASVTYANQRMAFGQEIGRFELVQQMIAKMVAGTEMGRLLVWRAGWLKNQGLRNTRETSLAKWHATEHAVQSALDAIQVHGANGYSNEFPVERYLRNSKAAVIYEGTSQLHTLIQADYALGYREDRPIRCEPWPAQGWERPTA